MITQQLDRARILLRHGRYTEAQQQIQQYLAAEPYDGEAHTLLAIINLQLGKTDEALNEIVQAISLQPSHDYSYYISSKVLFQKKRLPESEVKIREAIALNPLAPEYFSWLSQIQMHKKDFADALQSADEGLAIDPSNINCLNSRAIALTKLKKKDEAYQTIKDVLTEDPHNSISHANTGWAMLERNDHRKALNHFTESLRINPNNEWAKSGMIESLKARYRVYRIFLRYMFWIGNMKNHHQWMVIGGLYVLIQILKGVGNAFPSLELFILPVVILYALFAFSTWIIQPVFNLLLRLHPQGKYALSRHEKLSSEYVACSLLIGATAFVIAFFNNSAPGWLALGIFGITFSLPLASMYRSQVKRNIIMLQVFIALTGLCGAAAVILAFSGNADYLVLGGIYLALLFVFQFVANALAVQ